MPGMRALVVLLATTVIGALIGAIGFDGAARWTRVAQHAILVGVVASAFWSWAVYKVVAYSDSDLGAISFALVLAASAHTVRTALAVGNSASRGAPDVVRVRTAKTAMAAATFVVAANYAFILFTVDFLPSSFQFYLMLGAAYWSTAGLVGYRLAQSWEHFLFLSVDDSDSERTGLSAER